MVERHDDDPELPPSALLDTWTVPEPSDDLADRIADTWIDEMRARPEQSPRGRAAGRGRVALGIGAGVGFGAAAAVLLVLFAIRGDEARVDPEPAARPEPVVTAPAAAPAQQGPVSAEELAKMREDLDRILREGERDEATRDEFLLDLDVRPDSARVRVTMGTRTVADVVGDAKLLLPRGPYEVHVEAPGHAPMQVTGEPLEGDETRHELRLQRTEKRSSPIMRLFGKRPKSKPPELKNPFARDDDAAERAVLRIGTSRGVGPADVYVDGRYRGRTPLQSYEIAPGRHTIEWRWDDGRTVREAIEVDAGEVLVLERG